MPNLSDKGIYLPPSPIRKLVPFAEAAKRRGIKVYHLNIGQPDIRTPQVAVDAVKNIHDQVFEYGHSAGNESYRRKLADYYRGVGIDVTTDDMVITVGGSEAIFMAMTICLNPGDEVIIPTPCWVSYPEIVRIVGGVPVLVQGDAKKGFVTEAEDLAPYVTERTKALILNSPNNPNGCIWNREQLTDIAKLAVEKGFYVVSDEIYEKLIYDGEEHVSIASLGEDIFKQTIVINGVSKSYAMTGWRIGYTAGPTEVIKAMSSLQSQVASGSNSIAQYAAEEALRSPKGPEEIERMHKAYDERRRHIVSRLNAIDGLKCVMPKGAFYVMVDMSALIGKHLGDRKIAGSMDFADMLLENANVALTPGTAFCAEGYCRISYATSMEQIDKGVDRIEHFVNSLV